MLREHVTRDVRTVEEHGGMLLLVASMAAALLPSLAAALLPLLTERLRNRRIFFFWIAIAHYVARSNNISFLLSFLANR